MKQSSRTIVKNVIVAATLAVAALATWAVTDSHAPTIDAAASQVQNG